MELTLDLSIVRLGRSGTVVPATPLTIIKSVPILSWIRGDAVTLNGGNVAALVDKSGGSGDFAQATGAAQPSYTASDATINGNPTWTNNGTSQFVGNSTIALDNSAAPIFLWFVFKQVSWTSLGKVFGKHSGAGASLRLTQTASTPGLILGAAANTAQNNGAAVGSWVRGMCLSGNTAADFLKLGSASAAPASLGLTGAFTGFDIGAQAGASFSNTAWAELIITAGAPSGSEITALDAYGVARYPAAGF